jgi:aminopeptidase N
MNQLLKFRNFFVLMVLLFTSCFYARLNIERETPAKPFKYPVFTEADTIKGSVTRYRNNFDATYYNLSVDVDINARKLNGAVDIHFTALENLDTILIDLYQNLTISQISFESHPVSFYRKYNGVYILFNRKINKGEKVSVNVNYQGIPVKAPKPPWETGFVWKKDKNNNPWVGVACEHGGASLWWPVKDLLYDEPDSMLMNITVPKGLFCVSNGKLVNREIKENKETFRWKTNYPINTYNATIYIGDFKHFTLPYEKADTVYNLDFYVLPYNLEKAKEHFKQTIDVLQVFEKKFGEYPWWKEGFKLVESPFAGMEHQTAIAYGNGYKNDLWFNMDYIIVHEAAHEWWGNSVSAVDFAEIWLHEGFATFSEALYVEEKFGYEDYLKYLQYQSFFIKNKRPLIGPRDVCYWDYKDGDPYNKGSLTLHTLRNLIDKDSVFFDILKTFYDSHKYSNTTTSEFIALVNKKTGNDFNWFFNQYLFSRICPKLIYNYSYDYINRHYIIRYKWENVGNGFKLPVKFTTETEEYTLYPTSEIQHLVVKPSAYLSFNKNNSYIAVKKDSRI